MRSFPFATILLIAFASTLSPGQSTPAFNNDDGKSEDGTASRIGWFLEQNFQSYLLNSCTLQPLKTDNGVTVSSIPVPILNSLGGTSATSEVWKWVLLPKSYTAANAFLTINTSQSFPDHIDPNYMLPLDSLQDPETMLLAGTSVTLYTTNCTGIIAAAASVDSNIKALFASLSAAAKADYTSSTAAEFGLVKGDFNSPFLQMYGGNLGDPASMFAHMALWNWYRLQYAKTGAIPAGPYYALHWFNGYTLYQVDKKARQSDGSVDVSGGANYLGFVSGSASLAGQYKDYGSTTIKDYKFGVSTYLPTSQFLYDQLDTVDQIASWSKAQAETAVFSALPTFSYTLRNGDPNGGTHEQIIYGMPPSMCSSGLWSLNAGGSTTYGTLSLNSPARQVPASVTQPPGCAFSVSFTPNAATLALPSQTLVTVGYSFDTAIGGKTLEIRAADVPFRTSDYPNLAPSIIGRIPVTPVGSDLQWTVNEIVVGDPNLASPDPVLTASKIDGPTFSNCQAGGGQFDIPANGLKIDSTGTVITITLQQDFSMGTMPDVSKPETLTSCTVSMKLRLVTKSLKTADVTLPANTVIAYPPLVAPKFKLMLSPK